MDGVEREASRSELQGSDRPSKVGWAAGEAKLTAQWAASKGSL